MILDTLKKGSRIGDYEVIELLGSGGMASVYKGYDAALDREVAIKVISTADQSPDFISRFQREARVVASLRHPNIVHVYQFGEQEGIVYMVQELLPGPTLALRIRRAGRRYIPLTQVAEIVSHLASALDFAHSQGITHRDIKPSNALYNTHGALILTDFGIAWSETQTTRTTGAGVVMGTPGYVAPEQAVGGSTRITPSCDIYALGVVTFELLTSRLPFEDSEPMQVVLKHLYNAPPAPSSLRPDLPPAADKVVLKALSKEPESRYASAGALAQALQNALTPNGKARKTPAPRPQVSPPAPKEGRSKASSVSSTPSPTPAQKSSGTRTTPSPNPTPTAIKRTPPRGTPRTGTKADSAEPAPQRPQAEKRESPAPPPPRTYQRSWLRLFLLLLCIAAGAGGIATYGVQVDVLTNGWQQMQSTLSNLWGMVQGWFGLASAHAPWSAPVL